jgi:tetratricopeptide (TPR) repeat protein
MNRFRNRYLIPLVIAAVGVLVYSNTFTVPFQFDDDVYVVNNPAIRDFRSFFHPGEIASGNTLSPTGIPTPLRLAFMTRILGYFSLAVNYHLHGLKVTGYHVVNLLLHILNTWLVYLILTQTLRLSGIRDPESPVEDAVLPATLWEDASRKSPGKVRPHQNLGTYYSMQGRLAEAREELQMALRIDPRNYELHNNLGIVYRRQGDPESAMKEYLLALELEPSDPMAHYNIGNIYLSQGNLLDAIREYQACLKIAPDYDEAHNNLGIAYERSRQFAAAVTEFRKAIALNPENTGARRNLAETLRRAAKSQ